MTLFSLADLRDAARSGPTEGRVHLQFLSIREKETQTGKPFYEVVAADSGGKITLRVWNNSPHFADAATWCEGDFYEVSGEFQLHPSFGLDAIQWDLRPLNPEEIEAVLAGTPAIREKQERDYAEIESLVGSMSDPRIRAICGLFLSAFHDRFRRAAAARTYHHARRGGLVEHTAQMMRLADAIAGVYSTMNRDLLLAGALFHDIGKLWENCPEPRGFDIPFDERGELIGHITLGIEMLNALWRKLMASEEAEGWADLAPSNDDVRYHLMHLIASHHGELAFGSPVVPKTPEAYALHYIDNLDAKLEMLFAGYEKGTPLGPNIIERVRPLPGNLIRPLASFQP